MSSEDIYGPEVQGQKFYSSSIVYKNYELMGEGASFSKLKSGAQTFFDFEKGGRDFFRLWIFF